MAGSFFADTYRFAVDPLTIVLAVAGLQALESPPVATLSRIAEELLSPLAGEWGQDIAHWWRRRRDRLASVLEKAGTMLGQAGLEPQTVPDRILGPIVDGTSLEDDSGLQAMWVALLSNAASPGAASRVLPGYAEVLRQLVPSQARILDSLRKRQLDLGPGEKIFPSATRSDICEQLGLRREEYTLFVSDLERCQLIDVRRTSFGDTGQTSESLYDKIRLTAFALGFLESCDPPPGGAS